MTVYSDSDGYGRGTTAAGSALEGMASVISARGDYNLSTSAAAVNWTHAQSNYLKNRNEATNTYFDMRATNRALREAEGGLRPTMEQLAKIAKSGVPRPLSTKEIDPVSGHLYWPGPLQGEIFAPRRAEIDELMAKQASYGGLGYSDQRMAKEALNAMFGDLKAQIRDNSTTDYVTSRTFLNSLMYATTKSVLH